MLMPLPEADQRETWRIYATSTNIGAGVIELEGMGIEVGGFDHRVGAYVGCTLPASILDTIPHVDLADVIRLTDDYRLLAQREAVVIVAIGPMVEVPAGVLDRVGLLVVNFPAQLRPHAPGLGACPAGIAMWALDADRPERFKFDWFS